jgi:hypothetical protein
LDSSSANELVQERFRCVRIGTSFSFGQLGDHDVARRENFGRRILLAEEVDDPEELHRLRAEALVAWLHPLETAAGCLQAAVSKKSWRSEPPANMSVSKRRTVSTSGSASRCHERRPAW